MVGPCGHDALVVGPCAREVGVQAQLMVVVVVVDVAGVNAEARVMVGEEEEEEEALHETLVHEQRVRGAQAVYSFEAVEGETPHVIAVAVVTLQVVGTVAVQDTTVEQAVEARGENSWMPLHEWEDLRTTVEGRATKRTKQRRDSLGEHLVDSKRGHFVDQEVEAVRAVVEEEEVVATTSSWLFSNAFCVERRKHIEPYRDPEITILTFNRHLPELRL